MTFFSNLKTVHKLIVIAAIFLAGQALGAHFSTKGLSELSHRAEAIYRVNLLPIKELGEIKALNYKMVSQIGFHLQANDGPAVAKAESEIAAIDTDIENRLAQYRASIVSDAERKTYEQYTGNWARFKDVRGKVLQLSRLHNKEAATELRMKELVPIRDAMLGDLQALIRENETQAQENYQGSQEVAAQLTTLQTGIVVVMALFGLLVLWIVAAGITKNLSDVLGAAQRLAAGDLTARSRVKTTEETGALAKMFNEMAEKIEHDVTSTLESAGKMEAVSKAQAVIEFTLDGTVLTANENFLTCLGYRLDEIMGRHHRMFCDATYTKTPEYEAFWTRLGRGEFDQGVYRRLGKGGKEVWIQASYNPILDASGKPFKVVKIATDITEQRNTAAEWEGKLAAVSKAQAVIEFTLDGTVLTANDNFLTCLGYRLDEITGRHHRMFCDAAYTSSLEYQAFWTRLGRGEFDQGVYRRLGKGGKEIWIQASYNPILDASGKPYKVVKFATDITAQRQTQNQVEQLIRRAAEGQLSERIRLDSMTGTSRDLAESFNKLLEAVTTPLGDAMLSLTALAANDLTRPMTGTYQGEFEQMKVSLNGSLYQLSQTLVAVREAVESVSSGSEQITKGNEDLAQRTSEQAGSLEETSASMEEMTSTVKQNADNAKQANQLAVVAREAADKGGTVTLRAIEAMGEINKSSKKIADIITVIDEIAFQTNLLALNAAVEAARAGEHGRGFAVVAAEVRNLAQRSATAAKEIKGLINESIQRVNDGSELVNQSGKTLEEIVSSVKRVTDIIGEITAASQEQASGIDQVNKAIMSMDETTQQNAALVEETTSASQSLKVQATELRRRVLQFKLVVTEADKAVMPEVQSLRKFVAHTIDDAYNGDGAQATRHQIAGAPVKSGRVERPKPAPPRPAVSTMPVGKGDAHDGFEEF